jgi:hypothetical protein
MGPLSLTQAGPSDLSVPSQSPSAFTLSPLALTPMYCPTYLEALFWNHHSPPPQSPPWLAQDFLYILKYDLCWRKCHGLLRRFVLCRCWLKYSVEDC